jgi:diguanylate cyclase (GGDEF)-like protein
MGSVYSRLGDLTSSVNCHLKGLAIVQNHPNRELESMLKNCLGRVYFSMGNLQEAYKYSLASLESAPQGDLLIKANALNNIAFILHQMGQNERALEYALQSVVDFDQGNHLIGKSEALDTLGSIYLALGQAERAMESHQVGLELARYGQNRGQEINNLLGIARLQQRNGELQAARQTLLEIIEISQAIGAKQEEANANEQLAEICKQQGDYQAALHYFEAFHSISMKLSNEKAERRLQQMHVQYEVENIRKQANQYRELASTDALTGLLNRRRFFELAEQSLRTAQIEHRHLGVMMLDIDHFKKINDIHGHSIGDAVLVEVASRLRQSLRADDWAGRYGGDELVVVLHDANGETVQEIARRCQQTIVRQATTFGAAQQEITISLGAACYDGSQELNLSELVDRADWALLQAKKAGRNQVVLYEAEQ